MNLTVYQFSGIILQRIFHVTLKQYFDQPYLVGSILRLKKNYRKILNCT